MGVKIQISWTKVKVALESLNLDGQAGLLEDYHGASALAYHLKGDRVRVDSSWGMWHLPLGKVVTGQIEPQALGVASYNALRGQVLNVLNNMLSALPTKATSLDPASEEANLPVVGVDLAKGSEAPVKLSTANKLYQPVTASSPGSVYHTVALGAVNVAARYQGNSLSLRIEGDLGSLSSETQTELKSLGFNAKDAYFSGHWQIDSPQMSIRTVGAMLVTLGPGNLTTPLPDLTKIIFV